jgi:regulator of replication initiation timing
MNTYELKLPDESDDNKLRISLVKDPAVEMTLMKFSKEELIQHHFSDQEKRIIYAPAMIPNKLIYREDVQGAPANVFYTEGTIEKFRDVYFNTQSNSKSNLYHMDTDVEGVDVVESWIVDDPRNDKSSSMGFKEIPKGTWMIGMKINSDEIWNDHIKSGKIDGLSIESKFLHELMDEKALSSKQLFNKTKETKMRKEISKLLFSAIKKVAMESELQEYSDGDFKFYAVDLEVGSIVTDAEGNPIANAEFKQGEKEFKTDEIGAIVESEAKEEVKMADEEVAADAPAEDEVAKLKEENDALKAEVEDLKAKLSEAEAEAVKSESQLVAMAKQTMSAKSIGLNPKMQKQDFSKMSVREKFELERAERLKK